MDGRQDQSALTLLAVRDDYVCGSDGKTVAAHGLRDVRGVLNANGVQWTARKESQLFCPSPERKVDSILIKDLEAIQICATLHDVCIGKTGTLTKNEMRVKKMSLLNREDILEFNGEKDFF